MARGCERVVRRCIYSPPFHSDDSGNLRPLRLALASPASRPQSVIIVSKMVRSEGVAIVVVVVVVIFVVVVVVVFVSIVLVVFLLFFISEKEEEP